MRYTKTLKGIARQYNIEVNKAYKRLKGGLTYGIDLPTLSICCPDIYSNILKLKTIYKQLSLNC